MGIFQIMQAAVCFCCFWSEGNAETKNIVDRSIRIQQVRETETYKRFNEKHSCNGQVLSAFDKVVSAYADQQKKVVEQDLADIITWCESSKINVSHMLTFSSGREGSFSYLVARTPEMKESVKKFDEMLEQHGL